MSTPVLSPLDFNRLELLNARFQNLAVDPTGLTEAHKGLFWIDNAGVVKYWDGDTVQSLGLATGGNAETLDGNDSSFYLDRDNHEGTQAASTISDFIETVDDRVSALIVGGTRLTPIYDDVAGSLTLNVDVTGIDAATVDGFEGAALEKVANKGVANGYASLDGNAKIPTSQLPALALTDVNVVADIAARNALTVQEGDVAIVTDISTSYIYDGATWVEIDSPTDGVTAVTASGGLSSSGGTTPNITIAALGVDTGEIADNAITTAKMADGSVELNTATTTGTLPVAKGGTGVTTLPEIRSAIGATTKVVATIGNNAATDFTVTHSLNTRDVTVEVYRNSTPWDKVLVDVERDSVNSVIVRFAVAPASNSFRVVVVG